jgi:hypothetical protein
MITQGKNNYSAIKSKHCNCNLNYNGFMIKVITNLV